jgi:hypothetical protein
MWYCPENYKNQIQTPRELNEELRLLKGELPDSQAKISLAKFLHGNLGITTELLSGIKLAPFQEITLRAMMERNFSMCVWGRILLKIFTKHIENGLIKYVVAKKNPTQRILYHKWDTKPYQNT